MEPLKTCADVIPFVGNLIEAGSYFLSLVFATGNATVIIAIASFAYRPLYSMFLLVLLGVGFWLINNHTRSKNKQQEYETIEAEVLGMV